MGLADNRNMKRLGLSLFGGFAIPFLYAVIVGPLSLHIENPTWKEFAGYPVRWPILILYWIFPFRSLREDSTALLKYYCWLQYISLYDSDLLSLVGSLKAKRRPL